LYQALSFFKSQGRVLPKVAERVDDVPDYDGARGLFILLVMFFHFHNGFSPEGARHLEPLFYILRNGFHGVSLFFMLSGFLLFRTSERRIHSEKNFVRNFYLRRAFRILPLWWISTFMYCWALHLSWQDFLINATFAFGFIRDPAYMANVVGWTLFVEEFFYLFFPWIFRFLRDWRVSLGFLLLFYYISFRWVDWLKDIGWSRPENFFSDGPISYMNCFFVGVLAAHIVPKVEQLFARKYFSWCKYLIDLLCVYLFFIKGTPNDPFTFEAMVVLFIACVTHGTLINSLIRNRVFGIFGVCCYSLYLFHLLLGSIFLRWMGSELTELLSLTGKSDEVLSLSLFPFYAAFCLFFSMISYYLLEIPSIALGRRVIKKLESR
jgi:peptidoglycan/LPS O-acetylase OafA/YrhL